jgi:hypothetical protein
MMQATLQKQTVPLTPADKKAVQQGRKGRAATQVEKAKEWLLAFQRVLQQAKTAITAGTRELASTLLEARQSRMLVTNTSTTKSAWHALDELQRMVADDATALEQVASDMVHIVGEFRGYSNATSHADADDWMVAKLAAALGNLGGSIYAQKNGDVNPEVYFTHPAVALVEAPIASHGVDMGRAG